MSVSNPMSIETFLKVAFALPIKNSVLLRADHGLGKSQVVRQLRLEILEKRIKQHETFNGTPFPLIDRRLSQMSEGDMIGLPSTDGECTRFNPPDWYKEACKAPAVLFLDELNRATPEVMQAAFQIVLDRELNGWTLHPLTHVYAAVNTGASYSVNEIDPALLDRFFVVDLVPTVKDWLTWAARECTEEGSPKLGKRNVAWVIEEFIRSNDTWLDTPKNADPGRCHPSRRSWEFLSDALTHAGIVDEPESGLFHPMVMGFVGTEAAIALNAFAKDNNLTVSGDELLNKLHTKAIKAKVERMRETNIEALNTCIEKLVHYVNKEVKELTAKQGKNLQDFIRILPGEHRIACWGRLASDGIENIALARGIHKYCAADLLDVFGVPPGEAGVGVVPNVPGIFKKDEDK